MNIRKILTSRNLQNSFWNILEVILTPLFFFVSIPIFLAQLGAQDYGIWMFVNSVILVMQVLNLGLNFSTYKHVSSFLSQGETEKISSTLNTNLSLTFVVFLVSLIVCSGLSYVISEFNWFAQDISETRTLVYCLFLGMGILFVKFTEQILYNVYRAFENFKYVTILSVCLKVITVLGNILIAVWTKNILYIFIFTLVIGVLGILINYKLLHRFIPSYRYKWSLEKKSILFEINYSRFLWLQSLAVIIAYQGDRLLVSYGFGLAKLSFYAIAATLFNHIHLAFSAILAWLFPQIAKKKASKEDIYPFYLNSRNIILVISIGALAIFSLLSKFILSIWLGQTNYMEIEEYVKWFTVFEFFFIFNIAPHFLLNAGDNERFGFKMVSLFTGLNVLGVLCGYFIFNSPEAMVIGLAISTLPGMFIFNFLIDKKFTNDPNRIVRTSLLFIPSIIGSGIALANSFNFKLCFFFLCIIGIYFIFIKHLKTNFNIMIQ